MRSSVNSLPIGRSASSWRTISTDTDAPDDVCQSCGLSFVTHLQWYWSASIFRNDISRHSYAVERGLVVGFCAQPHHCYWPYYPTASFPSLSSYMVSDELFPDRSRPMSCWLAQLGSHPITCLWLWPATDHEPHCPHVPINNTWRWTESTPRSISWRTCMAGIYDDCSSEIIVIIIILQFQCFGRCLSLSRSFRRHF